MYQAAFSPPNLKRGTISNNAVTSTLHSVICMETKSKFRYVSLKVLKSLLMQHLLSGDIVFNGLRSSEISWLCVWPSKVLPCFACFLVV